MKVIIIDTSHSSSLPKVDTFLHFHSDADLIYTFDYLYTVYKTSSDLRHDLKTYPTEFFSNPCAYYDTVTSILGTVRKLDPDSVIVYSPGIDECSRLSNQFLYENYICHFEIYNPGVLEIHFSAIDSSLPASTARFSLKKILSRCSLWSILKLDEDTDDYDDYYSAG